jgi:hypothetical protein
VGAILQATTEQIAPSMFVSPKDAYHGPDPYRAQEQLLLLQHMWRNWGAAEFMLRMVWIIRKNTEEGENEILPSESEFWNRSLVPFCYNRIQNDIEKNLGERNIFVKPRQGGYTTYTITRRLYIECILDPGSNGLLISQNGEKVGKHFRILMRCHNMFACVEPNPLHPRNEFSNELHQHLLHTRISNRREIILDQLDCVISCESAEVEEAGQGVTAKHVVADEVARWPHNPEDTLSNLKESIPKGGTLDLVSTANGYGGYFFEESMRARDKGKGYREFTYHFHPWWFHDEYFISPGADPASYTKEEHKLAIAFNLTPEQIAWRRVKKEQQRKNFDEKYPEDDITCFLTSGLQFFDKDILRARWTELLTYTPLVYIEGAKTEIYKRPIKHRQYIIAADVASGLAPGTEDLDWSAAVIIDVETGEEMASYRAQTLPEDFGWDLADLGHEYNDALIAVERNYEGGTVILTLEVACSYPNIYKHIDWTRRDFRKYAKSGTNDQTFRRRELPGFPTTNKTRPLALNRLRWHVSKCPDLIYDKVFIQEALTFVYIKSENPFTAAKPAGDKGSHDDTVSCRAIAHYVRHVTLGYLTPETLPPRERYGDTPLEFDESEPPT